MIVHFKGRTRGARAKMVRESNDEHSAHWNNMPAISIQMIPSKGMAIDGPWDVHIKPGDRAERMVKVLHAEPQEHVFMETHGFFRDNGSYAI